MRGFVLLVICCVPLALAQASANSSALSASDKIVFASSNVDDDAEVFVVNPDGSQRQQLTTNAADDMLPAWSPDHARIAFARKTGVGKPSIWLMTATGARQHRLRPGTHPSWSPSGSQLVFERDGVIYTMTTRGRKVRRIRNGTQPVWAPRGRRIAYVRGARVFMANVDTRAVHVLADRAHGFACARYGEGDPAVPTLSSPEWSPDASRVVVSLYCDYYRSSYITAMMISVHGNGVIGDVPIDSLVPGSRFAWSADGTRLAFAVSVNHSSYYDLHTAKPDGTEETTVTSSAGYDQGPDW